MQLHRAGSDLLENRNRLQMAESMQRFAVHGQNLVSFLEAAAVGGLAVGEHRLHEDAHVAPGGVAAPDDAEAEPFVAGALGEGARQDGEGRAPAAARQRAEARRFLALLLRLGVGVRVGVARRSRARGRRAPAARACLQTIFILIMLYRTRRGNGPVLRTRTLGNECNFSVTQ